MKRHFLNIIERLHTFYYRKPGSYGKSQVEDRLKLIASYIDSHEDYKVLFCDYLVTQIAKKFNKDHKAEYYVTIECDTQNMQSVFLITQELIDYFKIYKNVSLSS